jgi:thiamine monophosphate synthase
MGEKDFLLAVMTEPAVFAGEAEYLEGLLEAGVAKLHLRKPRAKRWELEVLLKRLAPRWASRLVIHGSHELAARYGVPQIHGSAGLIGSAGAGSAGAGSAEAGSAGAGSAESGSAGEGLAAVRSADAGALPVISTSVHSWEELKALPRGLAYAFISPLFDSISKPGYGANKALLQQPPGPLPCMPVGLGGISADTIGEMIRYGWKGAAVLGWIWERPEDAVGRFEQLKKIIDEQGVTG